MKDKELRKIVYNTCKEFDEKLEFLFQELCKLNSDFHLERTDKKNPFTRLPSLGGMADGSIPDDQINWRHIRKTKCKIEY